MFEILADDAAFDGTHDRHPALARSLSELGFRTMGAVVDSDPHSKGAFEVFADDSGTVAVPSTWVDGPVVTLNTLRSDGSVVQTLQRPSLPGTGGALEHSWPGSGLDVALVHAPSLEVLVTQHRQRVGDGPVQPVQGLADVLAVLRTRHRLGLAMGERRIALHRRVTIAGTIVLGGVAAGGCTAALVVLDAMWTWWLVIGIALVSLVGLVASLSVLSAPITGVAHRLVDLWVTRVPPLRSPLRPGGTPDNPFAS